VKPGGRIAVQGLEEALLKRRRIIPFSACLRQLDTGRTIAEIMSPKWHKVGFLGSSGAGVYLAPVIPHTNLTESKRSEYLEIPSPNET
jgi:hypothetical protein